MAKAERSRPRRTGRVPWKRILPFAWSPPDDDFGGGEAAEQAPAAVRRQPLVQEHLKRLPDRHPSQDDEAFLKNPRDRAGGKVFRDMPSQKEASGERREADQTSTAPGSEQLS